MTFKDQLATDMTNVFLNTDEFADANAVYTSPAGVETTLDISVAYEFFVSEYENFAGRAATVVCSASDITPEIHGYFTLTDGTKITIQSFADSDPGAYTLICDADRRISPNGMR